MNGTSIYFVGTPDEIAHHALPLMEPLSQSQFSPRIVSPRQVVQVAKPGDVAVFYSEHFERFRAAIDELKKQSVATLYMIDGVLEWRNAWENKPDEIACPHTMRPVLCHKVACIGENQARMISSWGNQGKVEIVGVPRFDRYRHPVKARRCESFASVDNETPLKVLVVTAKTPAFTEDQMQTVQRSLLDLKKFAQDSASNVVFQWRLTAGLDDFLGVNGGVEDLTGGELYDQLQTVDAVIATPSTTVIEAMLAGRPTAVLNYHVCPTYLNPAWQINGPEQIAAVVRELRQPAEAKLHYQRHVLEQTLLRAESATDRMVELITAMAQTATEQSAIGEPLTFDRPLLERPRATTVPLNHSVLFPDDEAFENSDVVQLQALLSNARRHIGHLDQRIDTLEAELSEAHEIFTQINSHPVAGPIVRLRERILKVLSADSNKQRRCQTASANSDSVPD